MAQKLSKIESAVRDYVHVLEEKGIHVERAILFGSHATGHARDDSDVDIVIISDDLKRMGFPERLSFLSCATLSVDAPLEVLGYTPEEISNKEGKSIFWDEIRLHGKLIALHS